MKTKRKPILKLLSAFLTLCMVLSLLPMAAFSVEPGIPADETTILGEPPATYEEQASEAVQKEAQSETADATTAPAEEYLPEVAAVTGVAINETTFPDANFRTYVLDWIDTDDDNVLSDSEIASATRMVPRGMNIGSLQGIEYFTALEVLYCNGNSLKSLDLSKNTALKMLFCGANKLESLDLSQNTALDLLSCFSNQLTSLDLTHNPKLDIIDCFENRLVSLDVSNCPKLKLLNCHTNALTSLDVTNNLEIELLLCFKNQLSTLDIRNNAKLIDLTCYQNKLTALDFANAPLLERVACQNNCLTNVDFSKNPQMQWIGIHENSYTIYQQEGFDYTTLPGNFDVTKVSNVVGGSFDPATHTFSFDSGATKATYNYNIGFGEPATFTLICDPIPSYTVTVINGNPATATFKEGAIVSLSAQKELNGKIFDKWVVVSGGVVLANPADRFTTFKMPANDVQVEALYRDKAPEHTHNFGKDWKSDGENHWHECSCGAKTNLAAHSFGGWMSDGVNHWRECVCGAKTDLAAHSFDGWMSDGEKHWHECSCGAKTDLAAHSFGGWMSDGVNHWHECVCGTKSDLAAHTFDSWKVIQEPTATAEGKEERSCTWCGFKETRSISKLSNPFKDVSPDRYYYEHVLWAVNHGITAGISPEKFGPDYSCTRGQIVTFLWAAAGRPAPKSNTSPFVDVREGDYFHDAVLWATENHITAGVSADRFGPGQTCTRAHAVTFLWASQGKPTVSSGTSFSDVSASSYYYDAVQWAVANGVTAGVGEGRFGPGQTCIRAQIVTFLHKAVG